MLTALSLPFGDVDAAEVPLTNAPLALVLCQVRYPKTSKLAEEKHAELIRSVLGSSYPILREERVENLIVRPGSSPAAQEATLWRLMDKTNTWTLTIGSEFMAIATTAYTSRSDFCKRLAKAVDAVRTAADPVVFDRVGVRYVNRLTGSALDELSRYVKHDFLGVTGIHEGPGSIIHALTDFQYAMTPEDQIRARWGRLPAGALVEQSVPPVNEPSWILDIDSWTESGDDFVGSVIAAHATERARVAYQAFRWIVEDDLLKARGGDV